MNIIKLHEEVRFKIDHVGSARFRKSDYDKSINSSISRIVTDRIDNIKKQKIYAFETVQRVRDELYTLVKKTPAITPSGNVVPLASYPSDYKFLLNLYLTIDGTNFRTDPIDQNEIDNLTANPFDRPRITYPPRTYNSESEVGQTVFFGDTGSFTSAYFDYISEPLEVDSGTVQISTDANFAVDTLVIASGINTVYAGTSFEIGDEFTITSGTNITSGEVVFDFVNPNVPQTLDEEISTVASVEILNTISQFNKAQTYEREVEKQ